MIELVDALKLLDGYAFGFAQNREKQFYEELKAGTDSLSEDEARMVCDIAAAIQNHPNAAFEICGALDSVIQGRKAMLAAAEKKAEPPAIRVPSLPTMPTPGKVLEDVEGLLGPHVPKQLNLNFYSPTPTDLCRISVFHPMSKDARAKGKRKFIEELELMVDNAWGRLVFTGAMWSIVEEDVSVALCALINAGHYKVEVVEASPTRPTKAGEAGGEAPKAKRPTYCYVGSKRLLAQVAFGVEHPGKLEYERLDRALRLLQNGSFEIQAKRRTTRGKKIYETFFSAGMIVAVHSPGPRQICVQLNPYYYEIFAAGRVTLLDVQVRNMLTRDLAKAVYRFVSSHDENHWVGQVDTLCRTINLSLDQDESGVRRSIKRAIDELVEIGVLLKTSHLSTPPKGKRASVRDLVYLYRNPLKMASVALRNETRDRLKAFKANSVKSIAT